MTLFPIFAFGLVITGIVIKAILNARLMIQADKYTESLRQHHQLKWREFSDHLAPHPVVLEERLRRQSKAS
jgi:hypothetical protein